MSANNLNDLLDDALGDFEDNGVSERQPKKDDERLSNSTATSEENASGGPEQIFNKMFDPSMAENLQKEWLAAMSELKTEEPDLAKEMSSLFPPIGPMMPQNENGEASEKTNNDPVNLNDALDAAVAGVHQSAEDVKNKDFSESDFLNQMGGLNLGDDPNMQDSLVSMMEEMMKSLLSKDVLYPAMKQLSTAYGPWLTRNKDLLSKTDYTRFNKQKGVIINVCETFDEENEADTEQIKSERFSKIMNLVQQMQNYGDPPEDLMNQCGGAENLQNIFGQGGAAAGGMPAFPQNPDDLLKEDCVVM